MHGVNTKPETWRFAMTRLLFVTLALVSLIPALAFARPAQDFATVAFMTKDGVQVGQKIRIVTSEFGDLVSCGETYNTVYRGQIPNEFGDQMKTVRIWGQNMLYGVYAVEKLWKGDGEADCAVLVRVSQK
jgi:hypothetical protein